MALTGIACSSAPLVTSPASPSAAKSTDGPAWQQVWADDFNGPAGSGVNTNYWEYINGHGNSLFGTGEVETTTSSPQNIHLDGHGDLDIVARGHGAAGSPGSQWTSARIKSIAQFEAPAGGEMMVTGSIEQPNPANGLGYWPGFWMLGPGQWPEDGEIDLMEDVDGLSNESASMHCGNLTQRNPNGTFGPCDEGTGITSGLQPCPGCQQGFHTYSVIVDRRNAAAQQIRWYLDGKEVFSANESQVGPAVWTQAVDHGFQILLDVAIGGTFPNARCQCVTPTNQTTSPGTMIVQYVRVYTN
jgi:beta-glucanase (GH16 family)